MRNRSKTIDKSERTTAILMITPALLLLTIFVIVPLIMALYRSFFNYRAGLPSDFVGLDNYIKVIQNSVFFQSIINVLKLSLTITVIQIVISFLFANVLLLTKGKFAVFCRTIIYLPYLISGIVVAVIFTLLTTYNGGIINAFLDLLNVEPIAFNNDVFWSPISIIIPTIWVGFGYFTLVMYAGLINIPKSYFEAAKIDGAGFLKTTFWITIPCLKNYFILLIVTLIASNLQMFEIPMIMTNGQPSNMTMTPVLYLIHSRSNGNITDSEITAAAIMIMIIILIINSVIFYLFKSKKSNEWEIQ
jgi:ABC-type sugar transport system permease subunit